MAIQLSSPSLSSPRISSPCIKICIIEPMTGWCEGCGRSSAEIGQWLAFTEPQRLAIMAKLPERLIRLSSMSGGEN